MSQLSDKYSSMYLGSRRHVPDVSNMDDVYSTHIGFQPDRLKWIDHVISHIVVWLPLPQMP